MIEPHSAIYNKAQVLKNMLEFKKGNIIEAKLNLEKLYETDKDNPLLYSSLGEIYKELKLL